MHCQRHFFPSFSRRCPEESSSPEFACAQVSRDRRETLVLPSFEECSSDGGIGWASPGYAWACGEVGSLCTHTCNKKPESSPDRPGSKPSGALTADVLTPLPAPVKFCDNSFSCPYVREQGPSPRLQPMAMLHAAAARRRRRARARAPTSELAHVALPVARRLHAAASCHVRATTIDV
jgi:hypothetical protein